LNFPSSSVVTNSLSLSGLILGLISVWANANDHHIIIVRR
jgi:hypothetical protein